MWSLYLIALPFLPLLALKKKYRRAVFARFFLWRNPPLPENRIWFHACSFGETRALAPLLEALKDRPLALSVITQTGFDEGCKMLQAVRFLPFEPLLWFWVRPQKVLAVMEAELWYLLFYLAKRRGALTLLINARISDRSWPAYRRFGWLYRRIFAQIDTVYAQSDKDAERLRALGAKAVVVTGNIKLAATPRPTRRYEKPSGIVVTAASTHEGEEEGIVKAFVAWRRGHSPSCLLLVPRHPERFDAVADLAEKAAKEAGLTFSRWSKEGSLDADIVLIDTMGELINFYAITDIVVLGGAFVPGVGGHNPVEAIPFGCRLISGKEIFNQRALFAATKGAIFTELPNLPEALEEALGAEPITLVTPVRLEPIIERLRSVV